MLQIKTLSNIFHLQQPSIELKHPLLKTFEFPPLLLCIFERSIPLTTSLSSGKMCFPLLPQFYFLSHFVFRLREGEERKQVNLTSANISSFLYYFIFIFIRLCHLKARHRSGKNSSEWFLFFFREGVIKHFHPV